MPLCKDFRVDIQFFQNIKTRKLRRILGDAGIIALLQLWAYTAAFKPSGLLDSMDDRDVEDAAGWQGEPSKLISELRQLRFVDETDKGVLKIHDWADHNGWVVGAEARSTRARGLAKKRWELEAAKREFEEAKNEENQS